MSSKFGGLARELVLADASAARTTWQLLSPGQVYFIDPSSWVAGGSLSVTGLLSTDRVSLLNQGNGPGQIGIDGNHVRYGGVEIGTVSGGNGAPLTVTFNTSASAASVTALTRDIGYQLAAGGLPADHDLHFGLIDGAGMAVGYAGQWESRSDDTHAPYSIAPFITSHFYIPAVGDLNGDGYADLVMLGTTEDIVEWHLYDPGNPEYDAFEETLRSPEYSFNEDGQLIVRDPDLKKSASAVYLNDQHGGFTYVGDASTGLTDNYTSATLVDVNGDGQLDLVSAFILTRDYTYRPIIVNYGEGGGHFTYYTSDITINDNKLGIFAGDTYVAAGDLNQDGSIEFVTFMGTNTTSLHFEDLGEFYKSRTNTFTNVDLGNSFAPNFAGKPYLIDYDGDGDLDAIFADRSGIRYFENLGRGVLVERRGASDPVAALFSSSDRVSFGDIDADGDLDMVVIASNGSSRIQWNNSTYGVKGNSFNGDVRVTYAFAQAGNDDVYTFNAAFVDYTSGRAVTTFVSAAQGVLANDRLAGNLTAILESGTQYGAITLNADGSFAYTPGTYYDTRFTTTRLDLEPDHFTYRVSDGTSLSAPITVNLVMSQVVHTILAVDDAGTVAEAGTAVILAVDNDVNPDARSVAVSAINGVAIAGPYDTVLLPSGSTLDVRSDGRFTYHAGPGFAGLVSTAVGAATGLESSAVDSFTYAIDGSTATVRVTVTGADGVGDAIAPLVPTLAGLTGALLFSDHAVAVAAPRIIDGDVRLTTPADFHRDGATLTLSGLAAYDRVGVQSAGALAVDGVTLSYGGVAIGTVAGGNGTTFSVTLNAAATVAAIDATIEHLTYRLASGIAGAHALHVTLAEGGASPRSVSQDIALGYAFPAPIGMADAFAVDRGQVLRLDTAHGVLANDSAYGSLTASLVSAPLHGTLVLSADGAFTYTPEAGYAGVDSFAYVASDGAANSAPVTVALTVNATPLPNLLQADIATTTERGATTIAVLANDLVNDGPALAITRIAGVAAVTDTPITLASGATVTLLASGELRYDPGGKFDWLVSAATGALTGAVSSTTDTVTYTVASGLSATLSVMLTGVDGVGDQLRGTIANDVLTGLAGVANYFDLSQGGDDRAVGSTLNDAFYFGAAMTGADRVDGGGGKDQVGLQGDYTGANALVLGATTLTDVETIALLGSFSYDLTTNNANVAAGQTMTVYASELVGGSTFTFNGSAETDGKFVVYAGAGVDTITTGAQNDAIYFGRGRFGASDHVDGGAGTDQVALAGSYSGAITGTQLVNIETLVLLDDAQTPALYNVTLAANWASAGNAKTVYLAELHTNAVVDGSAAVSNLTVYGGFGNDTLTGGAGDDIIYGGPGADRLVGGAGADTFAYLSAAHSSGSSYDTIVGFTPGTDRIDLPGLTPVSAVDADTSGAMGGGSLDDALSAALANLQAGHAVQFTVTDGALAGQVFEVVNTHGTTGYQAGQDFVIHLETPAVHITDPGTFI